ncbi:MAG: hypothetical protein ABIH77_01055 [Pseudomonadota bacterium]|nr:hypothetical protein [Gammaproteobacteria bacterium]MBU1558341.1 hypothetical protein [Gammaproteobacteria bacterium]MBU1628833.1 hypothetical protein [Gammaproteobacteria bacterium]MBU1926464.1 hypothetical protein [Gammaproteobacteria bacterium]MBU2545651.1 hypothetical protein [Gammaproteobacteria bacterium]
MSDLINKLKKSNVRVVEREDGTTHIKRGPRIPLGTIYEPLRFLPWFSEDPKHPLPKPFEGVDILFKRDEKGGLTEVTIKYAKRKFRSNLRDKDIRYLLEQAVSNGWSEISAEGFDAETRKRIYAMAVNTYKLEIKPSAKDAEDPDIKKLTDGDGLVVTADDKSDGPLVALS